MTTPKDLTDIIRLFTDIGLVVIPFMGAVAFLAFVWGAARFIRSAGNEKEIKDSKNLLIWGIIGLLVLIAIWGIIFFLQKELGFDRGDLFIPQIKLN